MPKKLNETQTKFTDEQSLRDFAASLPTAKPVTLYDAAGKPTKFVGIDNGRGEIVASMSKRYGIAQDSTVLLSALDALQARGVPLQSAVVKQSDSRLHARLIFEQSIRVGKDESPQNLGAIVRNSMDGTTNVESSLFLFRSWCENGNIFGREDIVGGAFKHMLGVEPRILAGFESYFGNYGQVLLPWQRTMEAAQSLEFGRDFLLAGLKHVGLGERTAERAGNRLQHYTEQLGSTAYAAYQAATDVIAHPETGRAKAAKVPVGMSSFASEDRLQSAANRLLLSQPYYLDPVKESVLTVSPSVEFTPPEPLV